MGESDRPSLISPRPTPRSILMCTGHLDPDVPSCDVVVTNIWFFSWAGKIKSWR